MTMIVPGQSKGAAFVRGQQLTVGDLCRLQHMGKQRVYVEEANTTEGEWVHENQAALTFARAMAGEGCDSRSRRKREKSILPRTGMAFL